MQRKPRKTGYVAGMGAQVTEVQVKVQAQVIEVQVMVRHIRCIGGLVRNSYRLRMDSGMGQMMKEVQLLAEDVQYRDGPNDLRGTVTGS